MNYRFWIILVSISALGFLSCISPTAPASVARAPLEEEKSEVRDEWQAVWQKTLEAARKEGTVSVYSSAGSDIRNAFNEAFPKATGVRLDFITGSSSGLLAKITTERNAGLYILDVYMGGPNPSLDLKSKGYLQPIRSALILTEVTDPNMWFQKKLPFADINEDTIFSFRANPGGHNVTINTEHVKENELASYHDLLNPKWKGKITISDVTTAGGGQKWFMISVNYWGLDVDYMKQLAIQEPYITRDERQQGEWVARGKYPIGIAVSGDVMAEFVKAGAPIKEISPKEEKFYVSTGAGNVVLMNKAPHPNAAKVFINWLLSREGQTVFSKTRLDKSARIDVSSDHLPAYRKLNLKAEYLIVDKEGNLTMDPIAIQKSQELAGEIFGGLIRK